MPILKYFLYLALSSDGSASRVCLVLNEWRLGFYQTLKQIQQTCSDAPELRYLRGDSTVPHSYVDKMSIISDVITYLSSFSYIWLIQFFFLQSFLSTVAWPHRNIMAEELSLIWRSRNSLLTSCYCVNYWSQLW